MSGATEAKPTCVGYILVNFRTEITLFLSHIPHLNCHDAAGIHSRSVGKIERGLTVRINRKTMLSRYKRLLIVKLILAVSHFKLSILSIFN